MLPSLFLESAILFSDSVSQTERFFMSQWNCCHCCTARDHRLKDIILITSGQKRIGRYIVVLVFDNSIFKRGNSIHNNLPQYTRLQMSTNIVVNDFTVMRPPTEINSTSDHWIKKTADRETHIECILTYIKHIVNVFCQPWWNDTCQREMTSTGLSESERRARRWTGRCGVIPATLDDRKCKEKEMNVF